MNAEDLSTGRRTYDSSGRQAQARATRARIRDAAARLFVEQGYAGTSIAAIAKAAGVASQTVYGAFGAKAAILKEAVEVTLAGGDEPIPVFERADAQRVVEAATPAAAAEALARQCRLIFDRTADLLHAAEVAALDEPEIAVMSQRGAEGRLIDMGRTIDALADRGFLRDGVSAEQATDVVWALSSPDVYRSCTRHRGWTPDAYERWLRDAVGLVVG